MYEEQELLVVDFNLPNHCNELSKATDVLEKLKKKVEELKIKRTIDGDQHTILFAEVNRVLHYVAGLSIPAFDVEENLKDMYFKQYRHSPVLARKLWLDHYEKIHHPYSVLKNRCFNLLEELDRMYIKRYGKNPPNYKYSIFNA